MLQTTETNGEFLNCLRVNLSMGNLKIISNEQMLTGDVIIVLQKMLKNNL